MNKCQAVRDLQEYVRSQLVGFDDMPADGLSATLISCTIVLDACSHLSGLVENVAGRGAQRGY